jgi:ferritin-like metal-binding protein YciE
VAAKKLGKRFEDMPISNAQELFVHELGEIYDAEHQFLEGQQEMIQNSTDESLKGAIQEHLEQTRQHAVNVERVFAELGVGTHRETNEVAKGLVSEAQEGIQEAQSDALRDAAIVSAVIKVEHFEMGSYRSLVTAANLMGQTEIERLLRENMQQEEETARIAEQSAEELLQKAMQEGEQGEEEGLMDKAKDKLTGGQ